MSARSTYFTKKITGPPIGYNPIVDRILADKVQLFREKSTGLPGPGATGNLQINGIWFKTSLVNTETNEPIPGSPPQSISVSEENFIHKFDTLRTSDSAKINSGHSRSIISVSSVFTGDGIEHILCPIVYSLKRFPLCFLENELLRRVLPIPEHEAIAAFIRSVNINTIPSLPGTLQVSFQFIWFNPRPFTPRIRFRSEWFNEGTAKVTAKLNEIGRSTFINRYGPLGIAANAAIGNSYTERIEEAFPLLFYLYEGYDENIPISSLIEIEPGYQLTSEEIANSAFEFTFPIYQVPLKVKNADGDVVSLHEAITDRGEKAKKQGGVAEVQTDDPDFTYYTGHGNPRHITHRDSMNRMLGQGSAGEYRPIVGPLWEGDGNFKTGAATQGVAHWVEVYSKDYDVPEEVLWAFLDIESGGGQAHLANYKFRKKVYIRDPNTRKVIEEHYSVYAGTSAAGCGQIVHKTYNKLLAGKPGSEWRGPSNLGYGFYKKKNTTKYPYQYLTLREYESKLKTDPKFKEWVDAKDNLKGQFNPEYNIFGMTKYIASIRSWAISGKLFPADKVDWSFVSLAYHNGFKGAKDHLQGKLAATSADRANKYVKNFKKALSRRKDQASSIGKGTRPTLLALTPGVIIEINKKSDGTVIHVWIQEGVIPRSSFHPDTAKKEENSRGEHPVAWLFVYHMRGKSGLAVGQTVERGQSFGEAYDDTTPTPSGSRRAGRFMEPLIFRVHKPRARSGFYPIKYKTMPRAKATPVADGQKREAVRLDETEGLRRALRLRGLSDLDNMSREELLDRAKLEIKEKGKTKKGGVLSDVEGLVLSMESGWTIVEHEFTKKVAQYKSVSVILPPQIIVTSSVAVSFGNNLAITPMSGHNFPTVQHMGGKQISATANFIAVGGSLAKDDPARSALETFESVYRTFQQASLRFREFTRSTPVVVHNSVLNGFGVNYVFIDGLDISTVSGRPFSLEVGMRLTGTKRVEPPKARLVLQGEDSMDMILIKVFLYLIHHDYYYNLTSNLIKGKAIATGKNNDKLEVWWEEADNAWFSDPEPDEEDAKSWDHSVVIRQGPKFSNFLSNRGVDSFGGTMDPICGGKMELPVPRVQFGDVKKEFGKLSGGGGRYPRKGEFQLVKAAYTKAAVEYMRVAEAWSAEIPEGEGADEGAGAWTQGHEAGDGISAEDSYKQFAKSKITITEAASQAKALGFPPTASYKELPGDLTTTLAIFMSLFSSVDGEVGVNRFTTKKRIHKALYNMARYLSSQESINRGLPGAKDFKKILEGERGSQPELSHPGIYRDLNLPPSPVTLETRDTNPDIFFYNQSDVTRCHPSVHKLINNTVSPIRERVGTVGKKTIEQTTAGLERLFGFDTTAKSKLSQGASVKNPDGTTTGIYARTDAPPRKQRVLLSAMRADREMKDVPEPGAITRTGLEAERRKFLLRKDDGIMSENQFFYRFGGTDPIEETNGTGSLEYKSKIIATRIEKNGGPSWKTQGPDERKSLAKHYGNSPHVDIIMERNQQVAHRRLQAEVINRYSNKDALHLLDKALTSSRNEEMTLRRAFPGFQVLFIEEDTKNVYLTTGLDDFYGVNAIESINVVHNKNHAASTCTIQLLDLDGALYNRRFVLADEDKDKLGVDRTGQITKKGKKVKENPLGDPRTSPFFSTIMKEGMKVIVKMGFSNDPEMLETVFVGQLVNFNQGHRMTLVCQSYGTELVAQRFGDDASENVDTWNADAGDVIHGVLEREELKHFGSWKLQDASLLGRVFGTDELRPDGKIYTTWKWCPTKADDNIYFPNFSDSWGWYDKLCGHIQYVFWQTTVWEVLKEMELRHPGHIAYPVPYGGRMTIFFGNPNMQYLYRPSTNYSERVSQLGAELSGTNTATPMLRKPTRGRRRGVQMPWIDPETHFYRNTLFNLMREIHAFRSVNPKITAREALKKNPRVFARAILGHGEAKLDRVRSLLTLSGQYEKLKAIAASYGKIKNNQLPASLPAGEFWAAARLDHEGRVRPFRNWIYATDFNHIISNNIRCDKEGTFNSIELKYTDKDDVDFEEFNDGEDVTSMTIKADDTIKAHHIRHDRRSFPNCNSTETAERYGAQLLANSLKDIYKGELLMMGNPAIKPYDIIWMNDVYTGISGPVEVKEVVHSMSPQTGYICEVAPHLIVAVNETITETFLQTTGRFFADLFSEQARVYSEAAGRIDLSDQLVNGTVANRLSELGAGHVAPDGKVYIRGNINTPEADQDPGTPGALVAARTVGTGGLAAMAILAHPIVAPIALAFAAFGLYKFISYASTRQPLNITPLMKNDKPYILGIEGFENDTLMVATDKGWKYFAEGVSDGIDFAGTVIDNFISDIIY